MPPSHCKWNELQNTSAESALAFRAFLRDDDLLLYTRNAHMTKKKAPQHLLPELTIASVPDLIPFLESHTCTLLFSDRLWWLHEMLGTTPTIPWATLLRQCRKTDRTTLNSGITHTECSLGCYWESKLISHLLYKYSMNYTTKVLPNTLSGRKNNKQKNRKIPLVARDCLKISSVMLNIAFRICQHGVRQL